MNFLPRLERLRIRMKEPFGETQELSFPTNFPQSMTSLDLAGFGLEFCSHRIAAGIYSLPACLPCLPACC